MWNRVFQTLVCLVAGVGGALAQTENVIYNFQGGSDGSAPSSALVADAAGDLYGATPYGGGTKCAFAGATGCGVVFEVYPPKMAGGPWTESVLYRFQGGTDGISPGGVVLDRQGNLYGATAAGGTGPNCIADTTGCGTVFQLSRQASSALWTETILYSFQNGNDGGVPTSLIFGADHNLYGVTTQAGSGGMGTIFQLKRPAAAGGPWTKTVLHNFTGILNGSHIGDGATPFSLTLDAKGNLYGVTSSGGIYTGGQGGSSWGTIFELTPQSGGSWKYVVLYRFTPYLGNPVSGVVVDKNGGVYGTTYGAVYQLIPGTAITLHVFTGSNDGISPYGGVILDAAGNLYGTCLGGGQFGHGIAYRLARPTTSGQPWIETILHAFTGSADGDGPDAPLYLSRPSVLYGTTLRGGIQTCLLYGATGCGTVFSITP